MPQLYLSEINIYPVKSMGGLSLKSARVEDRGFEHDRRWMLVDENGVFISQRQYPEMALIQLSIDDDGLRAIHKTKNYSPLFIPFEDYVDFEIDVKIWDDVCSAIPVSNEADCWFSKALQIPCRLVHMPDSSRRLVDTKYAANNDIVSFADGYPFLLIGQKSLDDLNGRLETPVSMNRFRPNLVVEGSLPFDEDNWKTIKIGEITFSVVKPCARCSVTSVNQSTGERNNEPLATLAAYRKKGNNVLFGQNLLHNENGILKIGDPVEIVD